MVLVQLETADEPEFRHAHARIVKRFIFLLNATSWPKGDEQGQNEGTFAPFDYHHALDHFRVGTLAGKGTSRAHLSELLVVLGASSEMVQIEVIERLADVIEVEGSLALAQHFYTIQNCKYSMKGSFRE